MMAIRESMKLISDGYTFICLIIIIGMIAKIVRELKDDKNDWWK